MVDQCDHGEGRPEKKKEPITIGHALFGLAGVIVSGIATYTTIQTDLSTVKAVQAQRGQQIQELREDMKEVRSDISDKMNKFNDKLDWMIDQRTRHK